MKLRLTYRVVSSLSLPFGEEVSTLSIDPDGHFLAAGGTDGHVFVWCLRTHKLLCKAAPSNSDRSAAGSSITSMTWLSGGLLFFGRENGLLGTLRIGKESQPSFLCVFPHVLTILQKHIEAASLVAHIHSPVCSIAYSEEIQTWATATNNEIRFFGWKRTDCEHDPYFVFIRSLTYPQGVPSALTKAIVLLRRKRCCLLNCNTPFR